LFASIYLIHRLKPSIIHVHSSKAGIIGRVAGWLLKIPTVFTPHGFSFLSTPNKILQSVYFFLERSMKPFTTLFLACSESELKIGREQVGFAPSRCALWKNTIPESSFAHSIPSPYQFEYICTIGRPSYQKNIEMLVRCMKRLTKDRSGIKCILVGTGFHSPMKNTVLKQIQTEGLEEYFIVREWVSHEEALAIMRDAVLFVLPSRYEGLPLSVIEAMALGKAVVATNVLGTRDIIIDTKTGILVQLDDDEAMTRGILRIRNDHAFRKKLESNAREEYCKYYNTEERIGELERIYASILTGAGTGKTGIHT
jgi:glycosyltransferase involved in cell wall biosynthesis